MPSICVIELDRPNASYYVGEMVCGTVKLTVQKAKQIKGIKVDLRGIGKVRFDEAETQDNRMTLKSYAGDESYYNTVKSLRGGGVLPAGIYDYDFKFPLTTTLPTSCEGRYGYIRYEISLIIERTEPYPNIFKKPISIVKPLDLNLTPSYNLPIEMELMDDSCYFNCRRNLICTLRMPYAACVPGQTVPFAIRIDNRPVDSVTSYFMDVIKTTIFTATNPETNTIKTSWLIHTRSNRDLSPIGNLIEGQFILPPSPPSSADRAIVQTEYLLRIIVNQSGCGSSLEFAVPLIVGTVPLARSVVPTHSWCSSITKEQREQLRDELSKADILRIRERSQPREVGTSAVSEPSSPRRRTTHQEEILLQPLQLHMQQQKLEQEQRKQQEIIREQSEQPSTSSGVTRNLNRLPLQFEMSAYLGSEFNDFEILRVNQVLGFRPYYPTLHSEHPQDPPNRNY